MVIGLSEEDEDDLFQQPRRPLRPVRPNRSKRSTKSAGGSRGGAGKRQRSGGEAGEAGSSVAKPCTHGGLSTANPRALKTGSMVALSPSPSSPVASTWGDERTSEPSRALPGTSWREGGVGCVPRSPPATARWPVSHELAHGWQVGGHLPQSASPYERLTTSQVRAFFSSAPPGTGQHRSRTSDPYQPHQVT